MSPRTDELAADSFLTAGSCLPGAALLTSEPAWLFSLQVAVQSFCVCIHALRGLAAVTEAVELDTNKVRAGPSSSFALPMLALNPHGRHCPFTFQERSLNLQHLALPSDPAAGQQGRQPCHPSPQHTTPASQCAPGLDSAHRSIAGPLVACQLCSFHSYIIIIYFPCPVYCTRIGASR